MSRLDTTLNGAKRQLQVQTETQNSRLTSLEVHSVWKLNQTFTTVVSVTLTIPDTLTIVCAGMVERSSGVAT